MHKLFIKKMGLDVPETDKIRRTIGLTLSDAYSTLSSDFLGPTPILLVCILGRRQTWL